MTTYTAPTKEEECPECHGSGEQFGSFACERCDGEGRIKVLDKVAMVDDALAKVSELGTVGAMKWLADQLTKDDE